MPAKKNLTRHLDNSLAKSIWAGEKEASGEERRNLPKAEYLKD
jgi:hypothetical protein